MRKSPLAWRLAGSLGPLVILMLAACGNPAMTPPGMTPKEAANTDVTILYPLPTGGDLRGLLPATARGAYGELVPAAAFALVPGPLDPRPNAATMGRGEAGRAGLRLVGVRIDPCFGDLGDIPDARCPNQIRLVFQGVRSEGVQARADDGAVHVFVALDRAELLAFAREILAARERAGGYAAGPLGPHPLLTAQGLSGTFAAELKAALLSHVGESRVTRLTFFLRTQARQSQWFFGLFDRDKATGQFTAQKIATTQFEQQALNAGLTIDGSGLAGNVPTPTSHADNLLLLLNTSEAKAASTASQRQAYDAALRIENPQRHSPETIDCVSCHVATPARRATEAALGLSAEGNASAYRSSRDLRFTGPARPSLENIHALGYLDAEPGVNQRTANESAAVADTITALLSR